MTLLIICIAIVFITFVLTMFLMAWSIFEDTEVGQMFLERIRERKEE